MFRLTLMAALIAGASSATEVSNPLIASETWNLLRGDVVGEADIGEAGSALSIDAPIRAHDAATVPLHLTETPGKLAPVRKATLVIDENPAPVVAEITFGEAMNPIDFEARVRVNQYSNVRVIAALDDGSLVMDGRFVKASGGCSAPASKDPSVALADMGMMRLKHFGDAPAASGARREAQVMIRHPNYSGLQRDQITQLFVPAHFINKLDVWQGEELLFTLEGGISISENPVFRFGYIDNGAVTIRVRAEDTEGNVFEQVFDKLAAS